MNHSSDISFLFLGTEQETGNTDYEPLPSLVICPPTLTGHWVYEVEKFVNKDFLKPLHHTDPPSERQRLVLGLCLVFADGMHCFLRSRASCLVSVFKWRHINVVKNFEWAV